MKHDALGDRMKGYERASRSVIATDGYVVLRLDGKAFHTYTRNLEKPYDVQFIADMNATAAYLCENISGVKFGYVQSDEISLVIPAVPKADGRATQLWFGGQVQKMVSVSAGMASAKLYSLRLSQEGTIPVFDSRVFTLPNVEEVVEYLRFRVTDARKNAITMAAQVFASHKQLMGLSTRERIGVMEANGMSVADLPGGFRNGRLLVKEFRNEKVTFVHRKTQEVNIVDAVRSDWVVRDAPPMVSADDDTSVLELLN